MPKLALPKVECVETSETYSRFVAEPVEKGFGVTLGNSLRRVLLSSLPGAAINWVKIDGVQHEFSTISNVKEDTMDFLLNTKEIRIRSLSQRPGRLYLDVHGEKKVSAGDIKPSADFEIANPDLHLATLDSPKAKLSVEFNVELGKGYMPARSDDGLDIGSIPIDAIFSPVRRVNYAVEPSRFAEDTSQERLILEVWTDKTITPTEAVSKAAAIIIEQFSCFRELAKVLTEEGTELAWQRLIPPEKYNMPLDQLGLSTHTYNSLRRGGITMLGQLLERGLQSLSTLAGFGAKSREEVEVVLNGLDIPFVTEVKEKKKKEKKQTKTSANDESDSSAGKEGDE